MKAVVHGRQNVRGRPLDVALITIQLGLVLMVIRLFQLESRTFFDVMVLVTVGFVINAALPIAYRLRFFAALSLASVIIVFGWRDGSFLIAFALTLIGACHLPVRIIVRVAVVGVLGALLPYGVRR